MNPAQFSKRITLQVLEGVEDDLGQIVEEWTDYRTVWTMIKTLQGREYIEASATQSENTMRFVIRYTPNIDSHMRIIYKNRIFEIDSVINDDEKNKTLTIIAKEKM